MATLRPAQGLPAQSSSTPLGKRQPRRLSLSTGKLARTCARHPWIVLLIWVAIIALATIPAQSLNDALTSQVSMTNRPESVRADELIEARLRPFEPVTETVVIRSTSATVDDATFQQTVDAVTARLTGLTGVVDSANTYYAARDGGDPNAEGLVSPDRHTLIVPVLLTGEFDDAAEHGELYMDTIAALQDEHPGFEVLSVGAVSSDQAFGTMAMEDLRKGEMIGVPIALLVLIVVFGALVAAGLPLILGGVSILVALGLTAIVGKQMDLFVFVTNVISMLGLAVGIDYSLFVIARYREERLRGVDKLGAIENAGSTASKAVLFSGTTVLLALAGMFVVPMTVFQSIGVAAMLVVFVAVAATMTLVPALLGLLGDKIDWPRRRLRHAELGVSHVDATTNGFWGRMTHLVMARPVISLLSAVVVLGLLALPAFDLERGSANVSSLPASDVKRAFEYLEADFAAGMIDPVDIVIDGSRDDPTVQAGIERLSATLAADPNYGGAPSIQWNEAGDLGLVEAVFAMDANSEAAYDAIDVLRAQQIPAAFGELSDRVLVTGMTAQIGDYFDTVDEVTPWVFVFVLGLSFILLLIVFRSIVVPAKAILMNLLSVGAAYGLLVLVFQKGYGADVLGFQQTPNLEAWLPVFLFCILFGLSMDYHVFLLSRIREHYTLTGNNRESVAFGLASTARIITGAALIMVVVFGGIAAGRMVALQEMGFGLAVAVFLDATIIRTILVPSAMALLGDANWYLPKWLHWLPELKLERSTE